GAPAPCPECQNRIQWRTNILVCHSGRKRGIENQRLRIRMLVHQCPVPNIAIALGEAGIPAELLWVYSLAPIHVPDRRLPRPKQTSLSAPPKKMPCSNLCSG